MRRMHNRIPRVSLPCRSQTPSSPVLTTEAASRCCPSTVARHTAFSFLVCDLQGKLTRGREDERLWVADFWVNLG